MSSTTDNLYHGHQRICWEKKKKFHKPAVVLTTQGPWEGKLVSLNLFLHL